MSKFVIGKNFSILLVNHSIGKKPILYLQIPISYSLFDIIQIIKMYTDYSDKNDWKFYHSNDENKKVLSLKDDWIKLNNTSYSEYRGIYTGVICIYGKMIFKLGVRGHLKYRKVYPTIIMGIEDFPNENTFKDNGKYSSLDSTVLKKISEEKSIDMNPKRYNPKDLEIFNSKLKKYFKNKYKILGEPNDSYEGEYQLVKK